jgi:hypothetical protein
MLNRVSVNAILKSVVATLALAVVVMLALGGRRAYASREKISSRSCRPSNTRTISATSLFTR